MRCHTDLQVCCSAVQGGERRGDWHFPDGERLLFSSNPGDIYFVRGGQQIDLLRRNNAGSPSGIYRCEIATNAVNDDDDRFVRETVYTGLYASGGIISHYSNVICS